MESFTGVFGVPISLFFLCAAILWFLIPFAIFGALIVKTKKSHALLEKEISTLPSSDQDVERFSAFKCD